jgi:pyruvate, orthophosphate dikinase
LQKESAVAGQIYRFGKGNAEGGLKDQPAIGLRGAYLCEMASLGLAVPSGFVISMDASANLDQAWQDIREALDWLARETGSRMGDPAWPLFLAARPSPLKSISGLAGAVLNIGFNDATVEALLRAGSDTRFPYESYCRFIQTYANIVMGDDAAAFDDITGLLLEERAYVNASEMRAADYRELVARFKAQIESHAGQDFPQDPETQLRNTLGAIARGWNAPRTRAHRKIHGLGEAGIAIVVQAMVFGNRASASGTGRAISRHPETGAAGLTGEFLERAQGPERVAKLKPSLTIEAWRETAPDTVRELEANAARLEEHLRDSVEVEFTLDNGKLNLLDARPGPRTAIAALKAAIDMTRAGLITREEAVLRVDPMSLGQLLHATVDPVAKKEVIAAGLPASPGAASGMIVFDIEEAHRLAVQGLKVILVRTETLPEDIRGLHGAEGVLTSRGGMTSHAAVIARGMGKPCVAGASTLRIDITRGTLTTPAGVLKSHDLITIDGTTGQVFRGEVPTIKPSLSGDFATLLKWSDGMRRMKVRANAETPRDAQAARDFGAEGIGLVRTEHMFFEGDRIIAMREMILADKEEERRAALAKIEPMLRQDFETLFHIMKGMPVTIRLLDPPLHEFLPGSAFEVEAVAKSLGVAPEALRRRVHELAEKNPMLGHRGVRLLLSYPEITEMQARAIFMAAAMVTRETRETVAIEIMVPLVVAKAELDLIRTRIDAVAVDVEKENGLKLSYLIGTMIELPRAALRAGEIAQSAGFFSFGTNDLTQTTFGISRDDSASFIGSYTSRGVFAKDPFISLDVDGVGELIEIAVDRGRASHPGLTLGICGEHGGDPDTIRFCEGLRLDYVSCSPFRVPIARLAAAQATLQNQNNLK